MAEAYSGKVIASGLSYGGYRAYVNGYIQSQTDDNVVVYGGGAIQGTRASGFGVAGNVTINGSGVTSFSGVINNTGSNWANVCSNSGTLTLARQQNAYNVTVTCNAWGQTVNGYGSAGGSTSTSVTVTIPARPYYAHGNPSITLATSCTQGQSVTIKWAKSGTQGNAGFTRFELWRGSTKLYSGSNTSYTVKPSDTTGTKGGSVTYTVKEIHTWYGSEKTTSASKAIAVHGPHGNPSITLATSCTQGQQVTVSWAKSATQGNASFTRFELWQGSSKLYSGSGTSYKVTPSSVVGSRGGNVTYQVREIHDWYGAEKTTSASKTIAVHGPHGNPTLSASKTTANYGESVNLSWAKSATQGNAAFTRFELWQGSSRLYSGSAVSKSVKPSDVTGPRGGTATYTLKEIHTWYGSEKTTQASRNITVRSGVVSVYDSSGTKHTGLVTAYDSGGGSHYVLISAYDSSGNKHSVV